MGRLIRNASTLFVAIILFARAHAQDAPLLAPFSQVISPLGEGEVDSWLLPALTGSVLSLKLEARSGDLDPQLRLYDEAGVLVLHRDNALHPTDRNVLVEAFTIPQSAVYRIEVRGGMTSGDYVLEVLPGYANWLTASITNSDIWESATPDQLIFSPARLSLLTSAGVPNVHAQFTGESESDRFYVHTEIAEIDGDDGWLAGLTVGGDNEAYYALSVSQHGFWRFALHQGDQVEPLRNWQPHPIIVADERNFSLAILANGGIYELFYNGQYIDSVSDERLPHIGSGGLLAGDASASPRSSRVHFSRFAITLPAIEKIDYANFSFVPNSSENILRFLRRAALIPNEGKLAALIPEASWQVVQAGVARFSTVSEEEYGKFVLVTTLHWETTSTALAGCGLVFGNHSGDDYRLAFVDGGGYGLAKRTGERFINHSFAEQTVDANSEQQQLILSRGGEAVYYLNGRFAGVISEATSAGPVAFAVLNYADGLTLCSFRDTWLWAWD